MKPPRPQMPHSFARWSQLCTLVWAHPGGPLSLAPSPALGGGTLGLTGGQLAPGGQEALAMTTWSLPFLP